MSSVGLFTPSFWYCGVGYLTIMALRAWLSGSLDDFSGAVSMLNLGAFVLLLDFDFFFLLITSCLHSIVNVFFLIPACLVV